MGTQLFSLLLLQQTALVIPSEVLLTHWDGLSTFPEVPWHTIIIYPVVAACELCGEKEDSSTSCSPSCLSRDELPSSSVHQAQEDPTRMLHLGQRSGAQHALVSA